MRGVCLGVSVASDLSSGTTFSVLVGLVRVGFGCIICDGLYFRVGIGFYIRLLCGFGLLFGLGFILGLSLGCLHGEIFGLLLLLAGL